MMLLDIAVRASIVLLAALAATVALRHRSAALRHWVVAAGIFSAAAVAPLGRALPAWDLPVSMPAPVETPQTAPANQRLPLVADTAATPVATPAVARPPIDVARLAIVVWASGFAISLLVIVWSVFRLVWLTRRATPVTDHRWLAIHDALAARLDLRDRVALLETDLAGMVGTWGWRRPRVLLPSRCASWSDDRIRIVLGHELAHIRRSDWGVQIGAEIVRAAFWCHPLFWIACARLRRESEQACDDAVLEAGVPAADYASELLAIARTCRPAPSGAAVMPIARPSTLEWRITAMLNTTLARRRPTRRVLAFAFALIAVIALSAASFRAKEQAGPMPLTGTVYDMTGAVLPALALTLEDAAGARANAMTDSSGRFDFGVVAPGRYSLTSTLMGFASITQDVNLETPQNWERAITMQVGTLQETVSVTEQRPATAQANQRAPVRIGGNIRPPRKLVDVRPVYPQAMRDAGFEGNVPLGAVLGVDGRVSSVRVLSAHAHPELAQAALDAVRQWQFSPTLLNGETVEVFMNVTVRFSLQD